MDFSCEVFLALLTFVCLTIGMIQDIRTRYTSNKLWLTQGGLGFITILVCGLLNPYEPLELIGIFLNIGFALFFGFLFFYVGAWGAGDSKALFALGFSTPVVFSFIPMAIPPEMGLVPLFLIILNFIVAIVIILFVVVSINLFNLRKFGNWFKETSGSFFHKAILIMTAFQVPPASIKDESFLDPVESYETGWKIQYSFFGDYDEDDEVLEARERELRQTIKTKAIETGRSYIWVRPQIPGLVLFWLAYVIWLIYGSIGLPLLKSLILLIS
ncbi:MAG: hypothetical protein D6732_00995 [Methanobacteriota archaeon]|nr:MAG: hypothetical protein D6732_00995 [Euryarchaeota archaeon]